MTFFAFQPEYYFLYGIGEQLTQNANVTAAKDGEKIKLGRFVHSGFACLLVCFFLFKLNVHRDHKAY